MRPISRLYSFSFSLFAAILLFAFSAHTQVLYQNNGVVKAGPPTQEEVSQAISIPSGYNRMLVIHAATFGCTVSASWTESGGNPVPMSNAVTRNAVQWSGTSTIFVLPLGNGCLTQGSVSVKSGTGGGRRACQGGSAKKFWTGSFQNVLQDPNPPARDTMIPTGAVVSILLLGPTIMEDLIFDGVVSGGNNSVPDGPPQFAPFGGVTLYNELYSGDQQRTGARFINAMDGISPATWNTNLGFEKPHVGIVMKAEPDQGPFPDPIPPTALCQDATISLDGSGNGILDSLQVDNGSFDDCSIITSYVVAPNIFTCSFPPTTVTLTVTDAGNNTSTCTALVTTEDNLGPNANCRDTSVFLDASGMANVTALMVDNNSTDNCGTVQSRVINPSQFNCTNVGGNTVTLTLTDNLGNDSTCTATVTVKDTVSPVAACKNITVSLGSDGNASIAHDSVDSGSSDNCGIVSYISSQVDFDCSDLGYGNQVTLTVMDQDSSSTCTAMVTVMENAPFVAECKDITISLPLTGTVTISQDSVDNGSGGGCEQVFFVTSQTSFDCGDEDTSPVTVTLTVTDGGTNTATCTSNVTIQDNLAPDAQCKDITVYLNQNVTTTITQDSVDNGSSDNCGIQSYSTSQIDYSCELEDSPFEVILTVTDVNGLFDTCKSFVSVLDTIDPIANCKDITVYLDTSGMASILHDSVDAGSSDSCDIESFLTSDTAFSCLDALNSPVQVTLTITDNSGQISSCQANVEVLDTIKPEALCKNVDLFLDANGEVSITQDSIDDGSSDECGLLSVLTSPDTAYSCSDVFSSPITATLTVTDNNGNSSTCSALISVSDTTRPDVMCKNVTVYLDTAGMGTIAHDSVDNGSTDNCPIQSYQTSQTSFDCPDALVTPIVVTLTVTDVNTNSASCAAEVSVQDTIRPVALCQDITMYLDQKLEAYIPIDTIDDGSFDNCGIDSIFLSQDSFDCSYFGDNSVVLTVIDPIGSRDTCHAIVTIDNNPNQALCCLDGNADQFFIDAVSELTGGISNPSGWDNGFGDYTDITFTTINPYYPYLYFLFSPGGSAWDLQNWEMYIDWNSNDMFEPSEKMVDYCTSIPFAQFVNLYGQSQGSYRMRIVMQTDDDDDGCQPGELPDPLCGSIGKGEVEDYYVQVGGGNPIQIQSQLQTQLQVFPNPFSNEILVTFQQSDPLRLRLKLELTFTNSYGRTVLERNEISNGDPIRIDASDLSPGTYFLKVNTGEEVFVKTVVKH